MKKEDATRDDFVYGRYFIYVLRQSNNHCSWYWIFLLASILARTAYSMTSRKLTLSRLLPFKAKFQEWLVKAIENQGKQRWLNPAAAEQHHFLLYSEGRKTSNFMRTDALVLIRWPCSFIYTWWLEYSVGISLIHSGEVGVESLFSSADRGPSQVPSFCCAIPSLD